MTEQITDHAPSTPVVQVNHLSVSYQEQVALWNLQFSLPAGKLVAVIGPNGAGKSTLLKTLVGLIKPDRGTIRLSGRDGARLKPHDIAYVPQRDVIDWSFPISVYDLVMMGRFPHMGFWKRPTDKDHEKVRQALEAVDMYAYAQQHISALSGGQQQRVFLARSIALDPKLFVLDEPLRGLDAPTTVRFFDILRLLTKQKKSVVMVHHYLSTAHLFDHLLLLNKHQIASGAPKEVLTETYLKQTYGPQFPFLEQIHALTKEGIAG